MARIEEVEFKRRPPKETAIFIWANATTFSKIVGVIVLLLAVFSLAQSWYQRGQDQRILECQAQFMSQVIESVQARGSANSDMFDAVDSVLFEVNDALETGDFTALDAALDEYEKVRIDAAEQKSENPLPSLSVRAECSG